MIQQIKPVVQQIVNDHAGISVCFRTINEIDHIKF